MRRAAGFLIGAALVLGAAGLWLASGSASAVDWSGVRAVVFESDDWGLCGFVPDAGALAGLDPGRLRPGRILPIYWGSTLEDSAAVAALAGVLSAHRGADGLPPVWQANTIVGALAPGPQGWRRYDLPDLPPVYARPGLWTAVAAAEGAGLWRAELHGAFHYDPARRQAAVAADSLAAAAAARGVLPFPGVGQAWELGPWRPLPVLAAELDHSLAVFAGLFGRAPVSVMAPDYVWDGRCERLWQQRGLLVIQGKREQRRPSWARLGPAGRLLKALDRAWSLRVHPRRVYLERNCRFEPVQVADPAAAVAACRAEVLAAWRRGEPAVIESHRINFVHTDPAVPKAGRAALAALLRGLEVPGEPAPLYLCDAELAQLQRDGTSVLVRGNHLVLRNLTSGPRLLALPAAGGPAGGAGGGRLVQVPAGRTLLLPLPAAGAFPAGRRPAG